MIGYLRGILEDISEGEIIVDVGGVGYRVIIPLTISTGLPGAGREIKVYTYTSVREDAIWLYGFLTKDQLEVFKQLITVSGVGPKGAQAILSCLSPEDLRYSIFTGDVRAISAAPGIGKKTAERVILELKDRISREEIDRTLFEGSVVSGTEDPGVHTGIRADATEALTALGYSSLEARKAVSRVPDSAKDVNSILKEALKYLS